MDEINGLLPEKIGDESKKIVEVLYSTHNAK